MTRMLEFSDKNFKAAIIKMFQQTTVAIRETSGKMVSAKKWKVWKELNKVWELKL